LAANGGQALSEAISALPAAQALNAMIWSIPSSASIGQTGRGASRPLAGMPIVVKDNIDVAGLATTAGSPGLTGNQARHDAPIIRQLKDAGAIVVGKTNLHELALGATSINPTFGTVLNPSNPRFTAGGSSGGSAAAVAVGAALLGVGTDTAGSSRVPASCCGIVGFRPSYDRYPVEGIVPISWNRDTVGLLARDVEVIIKVDGVLAVASQPHQGSARKPSDWESRSAWRGKAFPALSAHFFKLRWTYSMPRECISSCMRFSAAPKSFGGPMPG